MQTTQGTLFDLFTKGNYPMKPTITTSFDRPLVLAVSNDTYEVIYAGWGHPPAGHLKEESITLITGNIAPILYAAIAGHEFGDDPREARYSHAKAAKIELNAISRVVGDNPVAYSAGGITSVLVAQAVMKRQGKTLSPWLGATWLDRRGTPQLNAPELAEAVQ